MQKLNAKQNENIETYELYYNECLAVSLYTISVK